jgi:predicted SAM-dependent methyltransferase
MSKKFLKINLGSGKNKIDDFISLDYDVKTNPDYLINLEKDKLPFPDNSVDEVIAFHILEHLGEGYFHLLKELYRVCKNKTKIYIKVPYHLSDYFYDDPTHRRPITVGGLHLLSKKLNDICEENNYSNSKLAYYLNVDFEIIKFEYISIRKYKNVFKRNNKKQMKKLLNQYNTIKEVEIILETVKKESFSYT